MKQWIVGSSAPFEERPVLTEIALLAAGIAAFVLGVAALR